MLTLGDPAPWFFARSTVNQNFQFSTAAGRYVVLCLFGSAASAASSRVLSDLEHHASRFDVTNAIFFGVSTDPEDQRLARVAQKQPGIIYFWDFDLAISRLYGASAPGSAAYQPMTVILDQALRTLAVMPWSGKIEQHVPALIEFLDRCPPLSSLNGCAPVLVLPNVFEREFCQGLITLYDQHGGRESGFMRDVGGKTTELQDYSHKRRSDYDITDQSVIQAAQARILRRLVPEIKKVFQFNVSRIERNIIACYEGTLGGHFRAHRDNTTKGTAHRRFAVTINLNSEEFEGGNLWFPEFGRRGYRAPTGGAVVFSCSLLHEATPVTKGTRYAFLPFLYDEEAAKIRQANMKFVAASLPGTSEE